jgi:gamma-glutamylputrescine oxidase
MYDLIIIGGGMSGISVGHFFRDANLLLLEKGKLLAGASGNNAGFLISGFGEHYNRTVKRWGAERAREIQQIHLASHRSIHDLTTILEVFAKQSGSLAVALDERERSDLFESYEFMKIEGYPVQWVENPMAGMKRTRGALLNEMDGLLDSVSFWTRLARDLPVVEDCEVLGTEAQHHSILVKTSKGDFEAARVVFCLNAFAASLLPALEGRYIPLRGQMLEVPVAKSVPNDLPMMSLYGEVYWRFTADSIIFGGLECTVPEQEVGIAEDISDRILRAQMEWIQDHFAALKPAIKPARTWCSTVAFTVDGFPFIGELPMKNHYVLSGLCGLGHSYAMEGAFWLRELISHHRNLIPSYCSSDRIMRLPVYTGGDWRSLYEAWNH